MTPKRLGAIAIRQRRCTICALVPVAMNTVAFCFGCWPGGPVTPPPCLRCGSATNYYTNGICRYCHKDGNPALDACPDCHAWGTSRMHQWLCHACWTWRQNNTRIGDCPACGQVRHLGRRGSCRLCHRQASLLREGKDHFDVMGANRHGQQLFLADMARFAKASTELTADTSIPTLAQPHLIQTPSSAQQLLLFTMRRDLRAHGRAGLILRADPARAAALDQHTADLAARFGWSPRQIEHTTHGLRIVLGIQDSLDGPVSAADVELLRDLDLPVWTVAEVLTQAGLLIDDRTPTLDRWFAQQVTGLPEPMTTQISTWFHVMRDGSATPPRRRPRTSTTIKVQLRWALPTLRARAATGHTDLRNITREHVLDALPASGNPHSQAGQGLKSIFRLLKARKILFTDPTSRVKTGFHEPGQPLPADLDAVRAAMTSPHPAQAVVVALIAFHGLRQGHLQRLLLTDVHDARLHTEGRTIVLAEPVRARLRAWLDYRNTRWPNTINPYLFIHYRTASRTDPVGRRWLRLAVGPDLTPRAIREDRILAEAHATGGDPRHLTELFGLSIQASTRYTDTIEHPDLTSTR